MKRITVTIDAQQVRVDPGTTVLEAARQAGIYIPTLCHDSSLEPYGACRLCIVQIAGLRGLPTACTTPVAEGMVIVTETPEIQRVRRGIVELALADHPDDCLSCGKADACELLQAARYLGVDKERLHRLRRPARTLPVDTSNPAFDFDPNKCILCGKCVRVCDEIVGLAAIDFTGRGHRTRVSTFGGGTWGGSSCETCGECVEHCPTGALLPKHDVVPQREVVSLCPFCGVGCAIRFGVRGNRIVRVRGAGESPVNRGELCVKGRFGLDFVSHPDRLTKPLIRRAGVPRLVETEEAGLADIFREAEWDEALELAAAGLGRGIERGEPDTVAVLASAKCTNEDSYLLQKFTRAVLGTNNVDHCARLCHASTVAAARAAFGDGAMSNSIADIAAAEAILVIGSNTTECHPIIARRIKTNVRRNGARLIVADPRRTELAAMAELYLGQRPGTDVALLNAMMRHILEAGLSDKPFIERHCEDFEPFAAGLETCSPDQASVITGVPATAIRRAAEIFAGAGSAVVVFGMGITQHTTGVDNVKAIANLLMLTGNIGRRGTGFSPLRGQNNVQGACDMGALPNVYPGYQDVRDPAVQQAFSAAWGAKLPGRVGLPLTDMVAAAGRRQLSAMYIVGENPLLSEPDLEQARQAFGRLDFLAVQDIFLTETAMIADVVLPAASFAEKSGTFTNTERRVQLVRPVVRPPGEARADWLIVTDLSARLGYPLQYPDTAAIMAEIATLTPIYAGITHRRLQRPGGLQWPCPNKGHPGTPRLHEKTFSRGKGRFHAVAYRPPAESPSAEFPILLTTGRILEHFHTGSMSRRSHILEALEPAGHVDLSPEDAAVIGVAHGDMLRVSSPRGQIVVRVRIDRRVPGGLAFMAFHWHEAPANVLTSDAVDPTAKIPEFKVGSIRIEKLIE